MAYIENKCNMPKKAATVNCGWVMRKNKLLAFSVHGLAQSKGQVKESLFDCRPRQRIFLFS